jgi:hypothetical protein
MHLRLVVLVGSVAAAPLFAQTPTAPTPPTASASCADRYSITLYGGHASVFRPRTGHTWALYTRTSPADDGQPVVAETFVISWMPATLKIRPFAPRPETGVNLTHEQTMEFMTAGRRPWVESFGPFEITADRFAQGQTQKAWLESGVVKYHGLGFFGRRGDVMHCIDAVTRTDPKWEQKASPSMANGVFGTLQAVLAMRQSGFAAVPSTRATPVVTPWPSIRER